MKRVRFIAPARRELLSGVAWYDEKASALGARFAAAVEEATWRALAFPSAGSPASKRTRRVFVGNFPFSVVYRADAEGIVIFAIAHHARRPEYWQSRLEDR